MADLKENGFATGTPAYLRGIASNGNSIRVTKDSLQNFIGIYRSSHSLDSGQEIDLGNLGYGLYILSSSTIGISAIFVEGSYTLGYIGESKLDDAIYYGDINSGRNISFGRKEINGNFFLKNNHGSRLNINILRINPF